MPAREHAADRRGAVVGVRDRDEAGDAAARAGQVAHPVEGGDDARRPLRPSRPGRARRPTRAGRACRPRGSSRARRTGRPRGAHAHRPARARGPGRTARAGSAPRAGGPAGTAEHERVTRAPEDRGLGAATAGGADDEPDRAGDGVRAPLERAREPLHDPLPGQGDARGGGGDRDEREHDLHEPDASHAGSFAQPPEGRQAARRPALRRPRRSADRTRSTSRGTRWRPRAAPP